MLLINTKEVQKNMLYESLDLPTSKDSVSEDCQIVTKIQIVAKADFVVDGMVSLLEDQQNRYIVSVVDPLLFTTEQCKEFCPDVMLINSNVLSNSHDQYIREIHQLCKNTVVLLFGQSMADEYLYDAIRAGAKGYLNEQMRGSHLITALDEVGKGGYWVERHVMYRFVSDQSTQDKIDENVTALANNLSVRESEVLELILEGMTTNDIAARIFLSHQGVKAHLTSLFRKFEVKNRAQLIIHAMDIVCPVDSLATMAGKGLKLARSQPKKPVVEPA